LRRPEDAPFAMAGLWARWRPSARQAGLGDFEGETERPRPVETFAIITTGPNDVAAAVHDRMPVILAAAEEGQWLDADPKGAADLPDPVDGEMELYPVSRDLNNPANDRPSVVEPVES